MRVQSILVAAMSTLLPLVSAVACVAGGPADQGTSSLLPLPLTTIPSTDRYKTVAKAYDCCMGVQGTSYGTKDNQKICVMDDWVEFWYEVCVINIPGNQGVLDNYCIPGDGGLVCCLVSFVLDA